jgi:hypothetical protein
MQMSPSASDGVNIDDIDGAILSLLSDPSVQKVSLELARELATSKLVVNQRLYALESRGFLMRDGSTPPRWRRRPEERSAVQSTHREIAQSTSLVVVLDLGNVHDCLERLLPYSRAGLLTVHAFADLGSRCFGIVPSVAHEPGCTVYQATTPNRNEADVNLIWKIAEWCCSVSRDTPLNIIVVTKDQGFRGIEELAAKAGHKLVFCDGWDTLRAFVE